MNPPPLHGPLTQSGIFFSGEASYAEAGGQLQGRGRAQNFTTEELEVSNYVRFCLNPFLLPRRGLASAYGCPEAFDAPLPIVIQPLPPIPIPNKGRRAELFHFFHNVLAPYIGAIDGLDQPKLIRDGYRPWMANSPFLAYTAILSSSGYQAEARLLDVSKHVETIAIKVEIIKIINEYLKTSRAAVSDEAIAAVNHLLTNEWYYGDKNSQIAHMQGLQQMLRLRGGLEGMRQNLALYAILVISDYQIACTCERELSLHNTTNSDPLPALSSYPVAMESPLLQSNIHFVDICQTLDISKAAAEILDDMRFLTCSIIALSSPSSASNETNAQETIKTVTTARWIHDRVSALPSISTLDEDSQNPLAADFIYECIRIASTIYSSAILHRIPFSSTKVCSPARQQAFWTNMSRIPLSRWKTVSGIYLWLCLVFCPAAEWTGYGRFLKSMVSTTLTYIGLVDWEGMRGCVEGFLRVQRWLRGEEGRGWMEG
ncbi:hypothetical protein F5882DRAFT_524557 [Hyaloscypha sp. PMI_1271]|nr:hypothetical protein F5882DRAFT_524557 [Hyaloscypha sp. PMI_1271]